MGGHEAELGLSCESNQQVDEFARKLEMVSKTNINDPHIIV